MKANIHMYMVDRVYSYIFEAKFPVEFDDEVVFRRGVEFLNWADPEDDALTERGWGMYRRLLHEANTYLIQNLPKTSPAEAAEIVDYLLEYEYDDAYFADSYDSDFKKVISNLKHCMGVRKRTNYNSDKYWEYTNKIAEMYSQILQHDYDSDSDILFDCDEAFVVEWEEEKVNGVDEVQSDLEKVKQLTKRYIRCFEIEPMDWFGTISHPVATNVIVPNPERRHYLQEMERAASGDVVEEYFNLLERSEREKWLAIVDKYIDAAETLGDIYLGIIRGNWLNSWQIFVKDYLTYTDRQIISKVYSDHMEQLNRERERLFGRRFAA